MRSEGTNETMTFQLYKADVANESGMAVASMDLGELFKSYDHGEPVWMAADKVKMLAEVRGTNTKPVKPYRLPRLDKVCVRRVRVS